MEENKQHDIDFAKKTVEETKTDDGGGHGEHHHHHRSGHSHHHSRHHHRSSSKKKDNKFITFIKRNRSVLINILSCSVSVVLIFIIAFNLDFSRSEEPQKNAVDLTQSTVKIETSVYSDKVPLVGDAILHYMSPNNTMSANEVYKSFSGHKVKLNIGFPLIFTYRVSGLSGGVTALSAILDISENDDYRDARTYNLDLETSEIEIYNLKTGTNYYYKVTLTLNNNTIIGTTGRFSTEQSPRILNIDGAVNVRDIGGWQTTDGKTVKQGLLYRGSELDGAVEREHKITDRGLQQMIGELGIRFDMDLRSSYENKEGIDALGKNVLHKYYGVGMYSGILNNEAQLREIFSDLSEPDNYPIYVHCTYGRDRTGTVCYLLEALLGFSDENLEKEYEMSAFTDSYVNTPEFNAFVENINSMQGESTREKVENYLLSIGVTKEDIADIRRIFLTD